MRISCGSSDEVFGGFDARDGDEYWLTIVQYILPFVWMLRDRRGRSENGRRVRDLRAGPVKASSISETSRAKYSIEMPDVELSSLRVELAMKSQTNISLTRECASGRRNR